MPEPLQILVVMDDPAGIDPATDTTLALIAAACRRRHAVDICGAEALGLDGPDLVAARPRPCSARAPTAPPRSSPAARVPRVRRQLRRGADAQGPALRLAYYTTTLLLERVRGSALLVNDPRALRETNEKLSVLEFPDLAPETRVTRSLAELEDFLARCGERWCSSRSTAAAAAALPRARRRPQPALDPRDRHRRRPPSSSWPSATCPRRATATSASCLLDGEPLGAVLRVPRPTTPAATSTPAHRAPHRTDAARPRICARSEPHCRAPRASRFVGIDVIGDQLTEVNVTCPTGVRQINRLEGTATRRHRHRLARNALRHDAPPRPAAPSPHASTGRRRRAAVHARQGAVMPWPSPSLS